MRCCVAMTSHLLFIPATNLLKLVGQCVYPPWEQKECTFLIIKNENKNEINTPSELTWKRKVVYILFLNNSICITLCVCVWITNFEELLQKSVDTLPVHLRAVRVIKCCWKNEPLYKLHAWVQNQLISDLQTMNLTDLLPVHFMIFGSHVCPNFATEWPSAIGLPTVLLCPLNWA